MTVRSQLLEDLAAQARLACKLVEWFGLRPELAPEDPATLADIGSGLDGLRRLELVARERASR